MGGSPYLLSELLQEAVPVALQCVGRQTCEKQWVQSSPRVPIPGGHGSGAACEHGEVGMGVLQGAHPLAEDDTSVMPEGIPLWLLHFPSSHSLPFFETKHHSGKSPIPFPHVQ